MYVFMELCAVFAFWLWVGGRGGGLTKAALTELVLTLKWDKEETCTGSLKESVLFPSIPEDTFNQGWLRKQSLC